MNHGKLIRLTVCDSVHHIKAEVEPVLILKGDLLKKAGVAFLTFNEVVRDHAAGSSRAVTGKECLADHILGLVLARKDYRNEKAVLAVNGDHSVRSGAVVIDAVSCLKVLDVVADANLKAAAHDEVKLLTRVLCGVDGLVLKLCIVLVAHPVRLCYFTSEKGSQILNADSLFLGCLLPLALSRYGVRLKVSAFTFKKVCDADVEGKGALVNKGKGEIKLTRLIFFIFLKGDFGLFSHFRL